MEGKEDNINFSGILKELKSKYMNKADWFILKTITKKGNLGTIKLAEEIGIAPKNLIVHLDYFLRKGWITKSNLAVKPKGRKRVFEITPLGLSAIEFFERKLALDKDIEALNKKADKVIKKKK